MDKQFKSKNDFISRLKEAVKRYKEKQNKKLIKYEIFKIFSNRSRI